MGLAPPLTPLIDTVTGEVTEIGRRYLRTLGEAVGALAPIDAHYFVSSPPSVLTAAVNLGALATGYLKLTTAVGIASPSTVAAIPQADISGLVALLALLAPLASPALTSVPTAPTAALGTNTTQLATTAFVLANAPTVTPLHCSVYHNALQSVPDITNTTLLFNSEDEDTGGLHSTVTNTSRITIPAGGAGTWLFSYYVLWAGVVAAATLRQTLLLKNGAALGGYVVTFSDPGGQFTTSTFAFTTPVVAGDYFEVQVYQNHGSALNAGHATRAFSNTFTAIRVAA